MPELPEVETVRKGLENHLKDRVIVDVELRRKDLRFPFPNGFDEIMKGKKILKIERRAKYLLIRLSGGKTWLCHLGNEWKMDANWRWQRSSSGRFNYGGEIGSGQGPHDWVVIHLDDGGKGVYSDHRRFGIMDIFDTKKQNEHKLLKSIRPEPMPDSLTPEILSDKLKRKIHIKNALLDQKIIAGLGNIYVCEILNRAGISPKGKLKL